MNKSVLNIVSEEGNDERKEVLFGPTIRPNATETFDEPPEESSLRTSKEWCICPECGASSTVAFWREWSLSIRIDPTRKFSSE
jgi:hypothetical protein